MSAPDKGYPSNASYGINIRYLRFYQRWFTSYIFYYFIFSM